MALVALVKHSLPLVDPAVRASRWRLGSEGIARCGSLAAKLGRFAPASVVTSTEPKAAETSALIAAALGVPYTSAEGLHEHERDLWLEPERFEAAIRRVFERPQERAFGDESGAAARARFGGALDRVLQAAPEQNLAVVTHGTVLSLYVAAVAGLDGFALWRRLGLPSFVVLERPTLELLAVVESVLE